MGFHRGYNCSVKVNENSVALMGTWSMSGVTTDLGESSSFGDTWKQFEPLQKDSGTVTFNGFYDSTDTNGQTALRGYNAAGTSVTDIKFYVDAASYWIPSTTAPLSYVYITEWKIDADQSALVTASFSCKVSGKMVFV